MSECPVCGADIELAGDTMSGEVVVCDDCGTELEVLDTNPARLAEAPSAEEDWGE